MFTTRLEQSQEQELTPADKNDEAPTKPDTFGIFGVSNASNNNATTSELKDYLHGKYPIKKDQTTLGWWRVSPISLYFQIALDYSNFCSLQEQQHQFPIIEDLAHDYLLVAATSCACEQTFFAAANICTPS